MWAVPTIHPAATFRSPTQLGPLMAHVQGFIERGALGFEDPPRLEENPSLERLIWLEKKARKFGLPLSVDVESAPPEVGRKEWALLPQYAQLRVVGVGIDYRYRDTTGKIWDGVGLSWFFTSMSSRVWRYYRQLMADPTIPKVFVNGQAFDVPMLERHGCKFGGELHDIRDMRRAMVSVSRTGLAAQTAIFRNCRPWKAEALRDEGDEKGFLDASVIPRKKILKYNAEDTVRAAQVNSAHRRELRDSDKSERIRIERLYQQHLRTSVVGAEMSLKGFPVDEKRRRELSRELYRIARTNADELARLIRPFAKVKIVEPDQDPTKFKDCFRISMRGGPNDNDLAALLYKQCRKPGIDSFDLEVPLSEKCWTESGKPSTNRNALLVLFTQPNTPAEVKEICKAAWKVDAPLKAKSTFVDSDTVLSRIGPDGRLHASINTVGAETGRWTCSDPNLFNLSELVEEESGDLRGALPNVREMYWAGPGRTIVHRDFSGLELEVMLEITGDELLARLLASGDAHSARVREWFHLPPDAVVPKGLRKQGKTVGFSSQYAAGVETVYTKVLEKDPDARFEDVHALWLLFRDPIVGHVGIVRHWDREQKFAEIHGHNATRIMDRRRYYPPDTALSPTETSNYSVQGTAADIANGTMVGDDPKDYAKSLHGQLRRYFPDAWLAMHTYDSFDVICKVKDAPAINRLMDECMSRPRDAGRGLRIFKSDGKIDQNWGKV